ncbi:MAG TPA: ABC transporter permease [Patescibacteria group bacterium]|nr:ABC transporter permease [Patescibacteria group bacterium]
MNYSELFLTAIQALRGNIFRTLLTMLGIVIGIASVILIIALAQGSTSSITSSISALGSNLITIRPGAEQRGPVQSGNVTTLTRDDASALAVLPNVAAVSAVVQKNYQIVGNGENKNLSVQGVSYGYPTVQSITIDQGSFFEEEDEQGTAKVAVLGPDVVTDLFGEDATAEALNQNITIDGKVFRVIGVAKSKGSSGFSNPDEAVYIPVTTMMQILSGQNNVDSIQVVTDDPNKVDAVSENIKSALMDRHQIAENGTADFNISTSKDTQSTLSSVTSTLTAMLAGIASISLIVGGIGIMNIMMVTVTERTKEIGLLQAIGAEQKDILIQFLIESIVLTFTGGVVGIVLGELLALIVSKIIGVPFVFQIKSILLAVGVSTLIGIIFGLYPARKAAQLSPIDALRYE